MVSYIICKQTLFLFVVASQVITEDLLRTWVSEVDTETPFDVYESTKNFALLLNLRLYLGLDHTKEPDLVQMFTTVASTHWHGMFELLWY